MERQNAEKMRALGEQAVKQIEKDFGKGSIMKLGEAAAKMNVEVIPTGALSLDVALGVIAAGACCGNLRTGVVG